MFTGAVAWALGAMNAYEAREYLLKQEKIETDESALDRIRTALEKLETGQ